MSSVSSHNKNTTQYTHINTIVLIILNWKSPQKVKLKKKYNILMLVAVLGAKMFLLVEFESFSKRHKIKEWFSFSVNEIYNQKSPELDFLIHFLDNETFHLLKSLYNANEEGHDFHQILKLKSP